jgi:hypothetical protein
MEKSLERISQLKVEKILPGHGEPILKGADKAIKSIMTSVDEDV